MFLWSWPFLVLLPTLVKLEEIPSQQSLSSCELEKLLHPLVSPAEDQSLQVQALRQQLARILEQHLHNQVDNSNDKRSLESLARGGYIRNIKDISYNEQPQGGFKSGIRSFVNSDQHPNYSQLLDASKRSIESLARNGELIVPNRSDDQNPEIPTKKGLGSLERDFAFPTYGKRFIPELYGKRNVASMARDGLLPGKRAHLRDYLYRINTVPGYDELEEKRNLASVVKSHYPYRFKRSAVDGTNNVDNEDDGAVVRQKRMAPYFEDNEINTNQNYDDNVVDYEELMQELNDVYPVEDKRFLGSIVRNNWPSTLTRYRSPDKRHIGSLARLGWLPAFRNVRRFNRSGRSATDDECPPCQRKTSANGETEDYYFSKNAIPLNDKRFLLIPAVDNILLRRYSSSRPKTQ